MNEDAPQYVPLLRIASAEIEATESAEAYGVDNLVPLFIAIPKNYTDKKKPGEKYGKARPATGSDVSERISNAANLLIDWYSRDRLTGDIARAYVDVDVMDRQYGKNLLAEMFGHLDGTFPTAVPVGHFHRSDQHVAIKKLSSHFGTGMALRLDAIGKPDMAAVHKVLLACGVPAEQTDLIYDLKFVNAQDRASQKKVLPKKIQLLRQRDWRSFTLLGGSMEQKPLEKYGEKELPRHEWLLWCDVRDTLKGTSIVAPAYGDYGVLHPNYELSNGIPHPYIRYTCDDKFWFFRESPKGADGREGAYRRVCTTCISKPEYQGVNFSKADARIEDVANNNGKISNPQRWVWTMTDHHLVHVSRQLAALH